MNLQQRRTLGKTGMNVSVLGFGGIVATKTEPEAIAVEVARAVEAGINYFDVAPSYGNAEDMLGPALEPYRKDVFLACKSHLRDGAATRELMEASLKKLRTDHFDVYQLHAVNEMQKDLEPAFAAGGALEAVVKARDEGIVRNIGLSTHNPATAIEAMRRFDFDTVMLPVNFCTHMHSRFEVDVITEARKRGMGVIAIKALARQKLPDKAEKKYHKAWYEPIDDPTLAKAALNWTLNQDVDIAISPGHAELLALAMEVLEQCGTLTDEDMALLKSVAAQCVPIMP